ncbi:MAG TPA: response regulator transcription factor [Sphingopyxis sp.]|uniref:response regulator transcription factor n=1 Tax=unclassified Sphingopyxis TaxID=2614943 RepID=UPI002C6FB5E4|nr:response regulator transcription factor [Sphingopyxis sp.]HWW57022.1 response regulator transcription factor [Sphingopyxis sp.]
MNNCLICDDHQMMLQALKGSVQLSWPDTDILLASDFPSAWAAAKAHPDLILCDLGMPGAAPVDGIRRLRETTPNSPILVVTGVEDDQLLLDMFALGVAGFIPKVSSPAILELAVRLILAGGHYLPERMIQLTGRPHQANGTSPNFAANAHFSKMTGRQIEVLQMIATGKSNKEIARALCLSPATVKAHVAAVIAALGSANRTEAAFAARNFGLI